jgi:hypothetical protein
MEYANEGEVFVIRGLKDLENKKPETNALKVEPIAPTPSNMPNCTLAKKNFLEFLFNTDLEELERIYGKSEEVDSDEETLVEPTTEADETMTLDRAIRMFAQENTFKCDACHKTFTTKATLKRHHGRSPVCLDWIALPERTDTMRLSKGLHLLIVDLLEKAVSDDGKLECKFCKCTFTNRGNLHKHFNTATVCNRMAYLKFKQLVNNLQT